jgi:hypothetical protein
VLLVLTQVLDPVLLQVPDLLLLPVLARVLASVDPSACAPVVRQLTQRSPALPAPAPLARLLQQPWLLLACRLNSQLFP